MIGEAVLFLDTPDGRKQATKFEKKLKLKKSNIQIMLRRLKNIEDRIALIINYKYDNEKEKREKNENK